MINCDEIVKLILSGRITDTRRLKPEYYAPFSEICSKFCNFHSIPAPSIYLTFSTYRFCEQIEHDNQPIIIYDQYLGQMLNYLNHSSEVAKSFPNTKADKLIPVMSYGYKFLAEYFKSQLESFYSDFCAEEYKDVVDLARLILSTAEEKIGVSCLWNRKVKTSIQEVYFFCHELAHIVFEKRRDYIENIYSDNLNYIEEKIKFKKNPPLESFKEELRKDMMEEGDFSEEKFNEGIDFFITRTKTFNELDINFTDSEKHLWAKEMTCDLLAVQYAFTYGLVEENFPPLKVVESLWLAHLYSYWVSTLKLIAEEIIHGNLSTIDIAKSDFYWSTRKKRIESIIYLIASDILPNSEYKKIYDELIDTFIILFNESISRFKTELNALAIFKKEIDSNPTEQYNELINSDTWIEKVNKILGWHLVEKKDVESFRIPAINDEINIQIKLNKLLDFELMREATNDLDGKLHKVFFDKHVVDLS